MVLATSSVNISYLSPHPYGNKMHIGFVFCLLWRSEQYRNDPKFSVR